MHQRQRITVSPLVKCLVIFPQKKEGKSKATNGGGGDGIMYSNNFEGVYIGTPNWCIQYFKRTVDSSSVALF